MQPVALALKLLFVFAFEIFLIGSFFVALDESYETKTAFFN